MRIATVLAVALLGTTSLAGAEHAQAAIQHYQLNIPRQSLDTALKDLAQQTGLQIGRFSERIDGSALVGPVKGDQTPAQALKILLNKTGLDYKIVSDTTIAVFNPKDPTSATTGIPGSDSPLQVTGEGSGVRDRKGEEAEKGNQSQGGDQKKSFWDRFRLAQVDHGASSVNPISSSLSPSAKKNESSTTTDDSSKGERIEEIVVTAQRREERLQDVPISVSAYSRSSLENLNLQSFSDLATVTPGLVITTSGGAAQAKSDIAVRGVISNGNAPTTGIYIDETSIATRRMDAGGFSGSPQPDIFDLDRVEVLRGPQGTLFGAGAMGGAIRYITPTPTLDSTTGFAKAEVGFTDRGDPSYTAGVAYGAPIIAGTLGARLSGWYQSEGGFVDMQNPYTRATAPNANAGHSYVLRPAATWAPVEGLTITPAAFIQHRYTDNPDIYWVTPDLSRPSSDKRINGAQINSPLTDDLRVYSLGVKYALSRVLFQSNTSCYLRFLAAIPSYPRSLAIAPMIEINPQPEHGSRNSAWPPPIPRPA
jgi:TonB-dependent receptor-like protein